LDILGRARPTLDDFAAALRPGARLVRPPGLRARLEAARRAVEAAASGEAPVYGLNTALGANLGRRVAPDDPAWQWQVLEGRAAAAGPPLPEAVGRAWLLIRLVSAARGHSGMSSAVFGHLAAAYDAGLSPEIPEHGSIGAGDLTQNACAALSLLGRGRLVPGEDAAEALSAAGLAPPPLAPLDAMALVNHGSLSSAFSLRAVLAAEGALGASRLALVLSMEGYGASRAVLAGEVQALRPAPGQAEAAAWLRAALEGAPDAPRRPQEALSFRTAAPVVGAAWDALGRARRVLEDELAGASDSPAVLPDGRLVSTPNFAAPALALALEGLSLALAMAGQGAVQRMQRMMTPALSGLPRFLSPEGAASAGMVPLQKTAAALLTEIRHAAQPAALDPAPVSEGVEDMAPGTPAAARKLARGAAALETLAAIEALVAAQALDLRAPPAMGAVTAGLHAALRQEVPPLGRDRPLTEAIAAAGRVLRSEAGTFTRIEIRRLAQP
jgi:histidine ammonia-lyase